MELVMSPVRAHELCFRDAAVIHPPAFSVVRLPPASPTPPTSSTGSPRPPQPTATLPTPMARATDDGKSWRGSVRARFLAKSGGRRSCTTGRGRTRQPGRVQRVTHFRFCAQRARVASGEKRREREGMKDVKLGTNDNLRVGPLSLHQVRWKTSGYTARGIQ